MKSARSLLFSGASYVMSVVFILGALFTTPSLAMAQTPPPKKEKPYTGTFRSSGEVRAEQQYKYKPAPSTANYYQGDATQKQAPEAKYEPMKQTPSKPYVNPNVEKSKADAIAAYQAQKSKRTKPVDRTKPVVFYEFRDPDSKEKIKLMYQPSTRAELLKIVPSKIRTQEIRPDNPDAGALKQTMKFGKDFVPEFVAFTTAVLISSAIHSENDPLFFKNFVDSNTSWEGAVGFAGFIAANRGAQAFLEAAHLAYSPQRAALKFGLETPFREVSITRHSYFDAEPKTSPNNMPNYRYGGGAATATSSQLGGADVPNHIGDTRARWQKAPDFTKPEFKMAPDWLNTKYVGRPVGPTPFQRNFAHLLGPITMGVGMVASNVIHEALSDENLVLCGKPLPKAKDEALVTKAKEAKDAACDKAWHDWVSTDKVMSYVPDILAMTGAFFAQGLIVNKLIIGYIGKNAVSAGKNAALKAMGVGLQRGALGGVEAVALRAGGERFIPIVLRGVSFAGAAGGWLGGPWGKFAMTVGNLWIFMELIHPMTPWIKQPWERWQQGGEITSRINTIFSELDRTEKNKWVWAPRTDLGACITFDPTVIEIPNQNAGNCIMIEPEQNNPGVLLKQMAERQTKWRQFILQDAFLAHGSWQKYVSNFATMYANAQAFYASIIHHINYHRYDPGAKKTESYLYQEKPVYGLYTDATKRDSATAQLAIKNAREWLEKYLADLQKTASWIRNEEKEMLPEILTGLRADDRSYPFASLKSAEASFRNLDAMTDSERREFEESVRTRLLENAVRKLKTTLLTHSKFGDHGITYPSQTYEMRAGTNPFMQLRILLGDPQPLPKGAGFVRSINDDENTIVQSNRDEHPDRVGIFRTETMADYLAVSMICGPDAEPQFSDDQKVKIYKERKLSFFERTLDRVGLGRTIVRPNDPNVMIAVQEFTEEQTARSESWFKFFSKNAVLTVWKSFSADFRPPRIVRDIPDLCSRAPKGDTSQTTVINPYTAQFTIDGKNYDGILDVIRERVRPDLVGTAAYPSGNPEFVTPLQTWWTAKVDKHIVPMIEKLRLEYREILKEKYIPALTNIEKKTYNGRTLRLGALAAVYDEAYLYLLILGKTTGLAKEPAVMKQWQALSNEILLGYQQMGGLVTDLNFVESKGTIANAAYDEKQKALGESLKTLKSLIEMRQAAMGATEDIVSTNEQAFKNLDGLKGELDSYWGLVRAVQVMGQ